MKKLLIMLLMLSVGILTIPTQKAKAKTKYTYYVTTLNTNEYVYAYDESKKEKTGIAYDAKIKGNNLKITGLVERRKGKKRKVKLIGEKTVSLKLSGKTQYYIAGGEDPVTRISKAEMRRYLRKGSKGLLSFGLTIKVKYGKVTKVTLGC